MIWPNWLLLSWDHLLPPGHPERRNPRFIVASCRFCKECHNGAVRDVKDKSPEQSVEQKKPCVLARPEEYPRLWEEHVVGSAISASHSTMMSWWACLQHKVV